MVDVALGRVVEVVEAARVVVVVAPIKVELVEVGPIDDVDVVEPRTDVEVVDAGSDVDVVDEDELVEDEVVVVSKVMRLPPRATTLLSSAFVASGIRNDGNEVNSSCQQHTSRASVTPSCVPSAVGVMS